MNNNIKDMEPNIERIKLYEVRYNKPYIQVWRKKRQVGTKYWKKMINKMWYKNTTLQWIRAGNFI